MSRRHLQGEEILLGLHTSGDDPTLPPAVSVHDSGGALVLSDLAAARDRYRSAGLFAYTLLLDSRFPVGRYMVSFRWKSGASGRLLCGVFEVVAGGDPAGPAVSMYSLERPHADYVAQRTAAGKRFHRRNPYL